MKRSFWLLGALVMALSAVLALWSLGATPFWDDEGETAFFGRQIVKTGQPNAWDGRNFYAYRNGTLLNQNWNVINPPLQFWLVATSFRSLGQSEWAARLPFVLAGLACLPLLFWMVWREWNSPRLALLAMALLGFNVPFLLFVRQCRYYGLALLFSLAMWAFWRRFRATQRPFWLWGAGAAAVGLYFSHYLVFAAFCGALVLTQWPDVRRASKNRAFWPIFATCAALIGWHAIAHHIWRRPDVQMAREPWLWSRILLLGWNLRDLSDSGFWPWTSWILLFFWWKREKSRAASWLALAGAFFGLSVLLSPQTTAERASAFLRADTRYLLPLLPLGTVFLALGVRHLARFSRPLASAFLALLLSTNFAFLSPWNRFQALLPLYIGEISRPYPTSTAAALEFLKSRATQDETVLAAPNYRNYPLMFALGDKVRFAALLDRKTSLSPLKIAALKAPLWMNENFPNWLVGFGGTDELEQKLRFFERPHIENGRTVVFQYAPEKLLPIYFDQTWRPEIWSHSFGPRAVSDPQAEGVLIFRRSPAQTQ